MSDNIHVVSLSKYTTPTIKEVRNKEWIEYGNDNDFFKYLIDRFTGSTTNNAIINGVSRMIYGKGISALDSNKKPESYAQMLSIFKDEDLRRFSTDRKMLGMASFQIIYKGKKVSKALHFPMNTLRPEKANKDGEIEAWYYHPDWTDVKPNESPTRIPSFGFGNKKENEIYVLKPYVAGYYYYSPVDYVGALPYAVLEEEIADYLINDTINGFSGSKVVNFNNGVPEKEKQLDIKRDVIRKLTGATGEKVIVAFNANQEAATTVNNLPLDNAPEHYQYLSDECRNKLIIGHNITSPMLIGVRETGGGLGNNADEIKTASLLFDNVTIKVYQEEITSAMDEILLVNDITLKLYFKTIQPLEFIETDGLDKETKEEETGVKMSKESRSLLDGFISKGQDNNEFSDYEIILDENVFYDTDDEENILLSNKKELSIIKKAINLVSTGTARPNSKSEQDNEDILVRYKYTGSKSPQRDFCRSMMSADKVYRKEDIIQMENKPVNSGWGARGSATYSIWQHAGGGNCYHKWNRVIYLRKGVKIDTKSPLATIISRSEARRRGFDVPINNKPEDGTRSAAQGVAPINSTNKGFLPDNPQGK